MRLFYLFIFAPMLLSAQHTISKSDTLSAKEMKHLFKHPILIYYGDSAYYDAKIGSIAMYYVLIENIKDGYYKIYFHANLPMNDSNLTESGFFINSKEEGAHIKYFMGDTSLIIPYKKGLKHGLEIQYNNNKTIVSTSNWVNGDLLEFKTIKNDSIIITDQKYYSNGNWYWIDYNESGKINRIINKINDTSYVTKYDDAGRIKTANISCGQECRTSTFTSVKFTNDKIESMVNYYPDKGSILLEFYKSGRLKAEYISDKYNNSHIYCGEDGSTIIRK